MDLQHVLARFEQCLAVELGRSPHTVVGYLRDLQQCIEHLAEQVGRSPTLQDFDRDRMQAWLNSLTGKKGPAHPDTKQRKKAALVRFFNFLIEEELWTKNPTPRLRIPKSPRRHPRFLSEDQALRLIRAPLSGRKSIWQTHDAAVLHLLYGGGLRSGEVGHNALDPKEVRGLVLDDVLLDVPARGQVAVRVIGKGDRERIVPLADEAGELMATYMKRRHEISGADRTPFVFLSCRTLGIKKGERRPLTRHGVYRLVVRYAKAIGIHAYPHLLRHSCATHMLWAGCDLAVVQDQMGHSDPSTTRIYASLNLPRLRSLGIARHPLSRESRPSG